MSEASCIDARTQALVRLGALIALDAPVMSYRSHIDAALAAGATVNDIVDTLIAVAPVAGAARLVAAAPAPAAVIGYDLDAAFEAYDNRGLHLTDPQRLDRREGGVGVLRVVGRHHLMPRRRDGTDRGPR
ncbi:MAG TPA: carboxymuconolactone decarboxylase family protein [Euzebyales bacterium]